jgi:hypothetical protein
MEYQIEWQYSDDPKPVAGSEPYLHFVFMLRFPSIRPGKGHVAHFCFNVPQEPEVVDTGISVIRRGFLACVPFSKSLIMSFAEAAVSQAFMGNSHEVALELLNRQFINESLDFSDEFVDDLIEADELLVLIEQAFEGVERGEGITLHQAMVIDDYGSQEDFLAAAEHDTEVRWQDVPDSSIAENPGPFNFLDPAGFRYYLPAAMSWSVRNHADDDNDSSFFTYLAVLPTVAPREIGRGLGEAFDLDGFIKEYSFTNKQVNTIYRFICYMAIRAEYEMDEDQYEAVQKWREAAFTLN